MTNVTPLVFFPEGAVPRDILDGSQIHEVRNSEFVD